MTSNASNSFLEPLESRIAPARIIYAGSPNPNDADVNYSDTDPTEDSYFIDTELGTDPISLAVGPGAIGVKDTHYLRMSAGDKLLLYDVTNGFADPKFPTIFCKTGNIVVFFVDRDGDNEVDRGEISGIALGAGATIEVRDDVKGDILTVLDEKNTKDTSDDTLSYSLPGDLAGLVSTKNNLNGITVGSSISGSIIVGGNISKVSVFGSVNNILAGSAGDGFAFDFFPGIPGGHGTVDWKVGDGATDDIRQGVAGSTISKINVARVEGRIQAGDGGAGAKGGNLTDVIISNDATGMILLAGAGGASNASKVNGGAGGLIKSVYIAGVDDSTANNLIQIAAGKGGNSTAGTGGAGGTVNNIFIGYDFLSNRAVGSLSLLRDNVEISSGAGGDGKVGGKGGLISKVDVNISTPDAAAPGIELSVIAGNGGAGGAGGTVGKAGAGGGVTDVILRNEDPAVGPTIPDTTLRAGDAGAASNLSIGGLGGSILKATLRGFDLAVHAGDGSSGKIGGNGGNLTSIFVEEGAGVITRSGDISSGNGGDGADGNGGKGGTISQFRIVNSDLSGFTMVTGNGGSATGAKGKGGAGGNLTSVTVLDNDFDVSISGNFSVATGNGGSGPKGGGNGGNMTLLSFDALNMNANIATGNGGTVLGLGAAGKGGVGGTMTKVDITALGNVGVLPTNGNLVTGNGGNGGGAKGAGGNGGSMTFVNFNVAGSAAVNSGTGGDGSNAAPGNGGDIKSTLVFASAGTGELVAGSGGTAGTAPAKGGSITGASQTFLSGLFSGRALTIQAGNGTHGGAGGSLKFIGFGSTSTTLNPTPIGQIDILAGQGSAEGNFAGAGGSISDIQGAIASSDAVNVSYNTNIFAGDVIATGIVTKSAAGGSITNLDLRRGGNDNGVLLIEAGDANDSTGSSGANGGNVKGVSVAELSLGNIFRGVAAGDGGNGTSKGGLGGSISDIKVLGHDVGRRLGAAYGYNSMGGLFAGLGGSGAIVGKNGSVTDVAAQMIASIVAGREAAPKMAEKVAGIYVGAPTDLLRASEQDIQLAEVDTPATDPNYYAYVLNRYTSATFVGATVVPDRLDGNKFSWVDANNDGIYQEGEVPIDGLIASVVFDQKTVNFTPEARFTAGTLYDFDNKY